MELLQRRSEAEAELNHLNEKASRIYGCSSRFSKATYRNDGKENASLNISGYQIANRKTKENEYWSLLEIMFISKIPKYSKLLIIIEPFEGLLSDRGLHGDWHCWWVFSQGDHARDESGSSISKCVHLLLGVSNHLILVHRCFFYLQADQNGNDDRHDDQQNQKENKLPLGGV